ncbi:hypothetical protein GWI33_007844 [Rhynchophorus ferrugineus]|uniref:Uncharacterized protein n=1 Tax=Rhynchophorus ferrugineus TaxID=354439 RepID=A0A834ICU6_RHYFE|nr:hypothetical protein GWI33_007844 [Rhynchophorus ferrugineus]
MHKVQTRSEFGYIHVLDTKDPPRTLYCGILSSPTPTTVHEIFLSAGGLLLHSPVHRTPATPAIVPSWFYVPALFWTV